MSNLKAEILSPAGDMERLKAAIDFGADAVYLAGKEFGMRTSPSNFDENDLCEGVKYVHGKGKKVYLTCNTLPRNLEIERIPGFIEKAAAAGVDAFIVADMGILQAIKKYAPNVDIHISTQAGVVNYATAQTFYDMGASRVVLARELSLDEIAGIRAKTNKKLELEVFVHGSMCVSFSGRCMLSSYLTGRDANRGDCAQPCRWKYNVVEENREGQYMPVVESEEGTYFFNSRDLCMIEHLDKVVEAGATSLKIEGRAKSAYYVAVTTNAYRHAIDSYYAVPRDWKLDAWIKEEVEKISHREYNTGFFFGKEPGQVYSNGGYIRNYDVVAVCDGYKDGSMQISQRNKFYKGDTLEILEPLGKPFSVTIDKMYNEWGEEVCSTPHAMQKIFIPIDQQVKTGAFLRKRK